MSQVNRHLLCFGLGYTARALAAGLPEAGWRISATVRRDEASTGTIEAVPFDLVTATHLKRVTHILVSIPPGPEGDPVWNTYADGIAAAPNLDWIGYLSTTGVYGDTGGAMVDETAPLNPTTERSKARVSAENAWRTGCEQAGLSVTIFRLAGIYGPGRSVFDRLRDGTARRVSRPGHLFSRIHVADIVSTLKSSLERPGPGGVYNLADDEPAEQEKVIAEGAQLLGMKPPPLLPFQDAAKDMSPMALSFWRDNRRIDNAKIKRELGIELLYPSYRDGLRAILAAGG